MNRKREARERLHPTVSLEEWDAVEATDPAGMAPEQAADLAFRLLAALPPRDRVVLTLRFVEDLGVEETAGRLGWSVVRVKVQTLRARQKLRRIFERERKAGL